MISQVPGYQFPLPGSHTREGAAARFGSDPGRLRQALPLLSDAEARELGARAATLDRDPAAGLLGTLTDLVVLALLVLLVLLVLQHLN